MDELPAKFQAPFDHKQILVDSICCEEIAIDKHTLAVGNGLGVSFQNFHFPFLN